MATIEKRGEGWRVRWRDPDGRAHSRQCPTHRAAKKLELEVEEANALGKRWSPEAAVRHPPIESLVEAHLRDLARLQRAMGTLKRAHAVWAHFLPWLKALKGTPPTTDMLTRSVLEQYDAMHIEEGNGISHRRVAIWAIGGAWTWASKHPDWCHLVGVPMIPRMPTAEPVIAVAATWAQLDAVVQIAAEHSERNPAREYVRRVVMLLRGMGWRAFQCMSASATDFDPAAATLFRRFGKGVAERAKAMPIPMPPWLVREVASWGVEEGPLIVTPRVTRQCGDVIKDYWRETSAPATVYHQRPEHAFRIGLVSNLAEAGVPAEAVEYYVGHELSGMRRHYVDPTRLHLRRVADAVPAPKGWSVPHVSAQRGVEPDERPAKRT